MNTETVNNSQILLVDNDPQDVKLTLSALAKSNLANNVKVVRDGVEALDYLYRRGKFQTRAGSNPILVLLDNRMPEIGGLQILKTIKEDEHLKMIPVLAFNSSSETQDLIEFFKHGFPNDAVPE
jgi:CheY-like chemotaxis protein